MAELRGFGLANFRSFRSAPQFVYPLRTINFIAGQNNSGKSNVLRFAKHHLRESPSNLSALDFPVGDATAKLTFLASHITRGELVEQYKEGLLGRGGHSLTTFETLLDIDRFYPCGSDLVWIEYEVPRTQQGTSPGRWAFSKGFIESISRTVESRGAGFVQEVASLATHFRQRAGGADDNVSHILEKLPPLNLLPHVESIEAFRQIQSPGDSVQDYNGRDLIRRLQKLERPSVANIADQDRFKVIERFLQVVLEDDNARLQIPSEANTIHVIRDGLTLPLEHLGTGVHQVVIIAAAAALITESLVCIEEPEVHLHPLLQKKLIRHLAENTTNRYLIATHSAHMLDYGPASVFHIRSSEDGSKMTPAVKPREVWNICADLGYRPSDLLQSNAIIWVEGPSDRIYLVSWLSLVAEKLIEGIHYTVMFYGGSLLKHLSADDDAVREFIALRRINRRCVILIDSDKDRSRANISATKQRVRAEFDEDDGGGFCWITNCRTIENYITTDVLRAAFSKVHPTATHDYDGNKWASPLKSSLANGADKVQIAHVAAAALGHGDLISHGLRKQLDRLARFVQEANDIEAS